MFGDEFQLLDDLLLGKRRDVLTGVQLDVVLQGPEHGSGQEPLPDLPGP